jgi:uncharacterized protein YndB with AHSA1/START domain
MSIPPVERSISVDWDPSTAFRRFVLNFGKWWPWRTHSVGGERVKTIVFEPAVGGRIFEEHIDGRRFQWGQVLEWDPPSRVKFTFHAGRAPETAQEVEVRFIPEKQGTRVELVASNWEKWGPKATRARRGYDLGWAYILNLWAGRRTLRMRVVDGLMGIAKIVSWLRGGTAGEIARAGGEITSASRPSMR